MNKFTLTLALATGLTLGLAAPFARAADIPSIHSLSLGSMTADDFNKSFHSIEGTPAMSSPFRFAGTSGPSGVVMSQVFKGTGKYAGEYAYAYQYDLNSGSSTANQALDPKSPPTPLDLKGASWQFNATPFNSAYVISPGGTIGGIGASGDRAPSQLNWETNTSTGSLLATYFDPIKSTTALQGGQHSATFVVLSNQPFVQSYVGILGTNPIDPKAPLTTTFAANGGTIQPIPLPEPTTVLAWAGMIGAVALVRRVRKNRPTVA